jgi:2,4-diaminopentanoate dehydrogenase
MQRLRVIQWTTGRVGKHALRAIIDDPRLDLAGVYAHSRDKAGRDAGELCGKPATGIRATSDIAALLALGADCVLYAAQIPIVDELERLLAAGVDVVCTATFGRTGGMDAGIRRRLESACASGQSSLYITGVNPGWINSIAVALTATCCSVERVHIMESANVSNYASPETWLAHGMSLPASTPGTVDSTRQSLLPFRDAVSRMAEALDLEVDEIRFTTAHATARHEVDHGWIRIPRDHIAAVRATWSAISGGRERLATSVAWRLTDELNSDWPMQKQAYVVQLDSRPNLVATVEWVTPADWHPTDYSILTALPAVNSVVPVHGCKPGLLTLRDVGLPYSPVGLWK